MPGFLKKRGLMRRGTINFLILLFSSCILLALNLVWYLLLIPSLMDLIISITVIVLTLAFIHHRLLTQNFLVEGRNNMVSVLVVALLNFLIAFLLFVFFFIEALSESG